ncbi:pilus assembly protein [Parazoarcus communis]|uniref:pilus assembly protein n=1 Tax=Parazoarcus communis TaxID=41977 RepID=UPI002006E6DE|nr:PilC/PilY family type IV pilus protein [Parazoarcus communis]
MLKTARISVAIIAAITAMPIFAQIDIASKPIFLNPPDPRLMLILSRDHELTKKAYNDYSDIDPINPGFEITYTDSFDYYGYFDSRKCYIYNNNRFEPTGSAAGPYLHHCTGANEWSGNFLNWVSMTRMDVLRKTLYGGMRSTDDDSSSSGATVLQRAMLPNDVHAFAKTFAPAGGATDMLKYTPYNQAVVSFCNVTPATTGISRAQLGPAPSVEPRIQVAYGNYPRWAMNEVTQCGTGGTGKPGALDANLIARVVVCAPGLLESNCTAYGSNRKPTGLLQQYGESSALARVQFGLLTGSYSKNKSGGVIRKNTSLLTGNTTTSLNEINPSTGQFVNQGTTNTGIINTINRLGISGWSFANSKHQNSCNSPGISSFNNGQCVDWGNPLSEMYLESLRYFANKGTPTTAFDTTSDETTHLPSLPKVSWLDPLPANEWCALSSTVVLSTGLNSFDRDELTGHGIAGLDVAALTSSVSTSENISGSYLIGSNGTTNDGQCTAKTLSNLGDASGICPEVPSLAGGYHLAGLAYANLQVDLRPEYLNQRQQRWGPTSANPNAGNAARQPMNTYTVALAESLPQLAIPVQGGSITFLPNCMSNSSSSATATTSGWRVCSLTDLKFVSLTNNASGQPISGQIEVSWEDSTWGNDYDMDGIARLDFCVGNACSPAVASNQLQITAQAIYANAGYSLRFGYTVTGSTNDGSYLDILRPGGSNFTSLPAPANVTPPTSRTFTVGLSAAKLLESPLWYAAKYGRSNWDANGDGVPDGFFKVTNPAALATALGKVFEEAGTASGSASAIASNSTRLNTETHIYQAAFNSPAWTGELRAIPLSLTGVAGNQSWEASTKIGPENSRNILSWNGQAWNTGVGITFTWNNLSGPNTTAGTQQNYLGSSQIVQYLRGDKSNEKTALNPSGQYRLRASLLGDIVNSDPHVVSNENYGYDLPGSGLSAEQQAAYTTFRTTTKVTRPRAIYVGANDGMLHAVNGSNDASVGGTEFFTYVPNAVYPNLAQLSSPDYIHRYYVDGPPNSGDAYIGGSWKSILLGTLGAGGKAVFALDVTNPDSMTSSQVIWEYADNLDLGHIIGKAYVARLANGHWYAIFGNGYNSTSQKAVLYLVPLDRSLSSPLPIIKLDTGVGDNNGLSEPALVDTNGDRIIDYVYAGDLKGNVWKFNLTGNANNWGVAYKSGNTPIPLFRAAIGTTSQPITAALEIGAPPTGTSGYMVYFGTGKYLGNTDVLSSNTQSVYGILDSGSAITTGRTSLQAQSFVYEGPRSDTDSSPIRVVSNTTFSYTGANAKRGWYIDLLPPNTTTSLGERVVGIPLLRYGRVIFTSIIPSSGLCDQGGSSWITELDAISGARLTYSVFDYTGDKLFNSGDYASYANTSNPVSSKKLVNEGLLKTPAVISAGPVEYKIGSSTGGGIAVIVEKGMSGSPRSSWRQILPQ